MQFLLKLILISTKQLSCLGPLVLLLPKYYELWIIWLLHISDCGVPGEGYSRKAYTKADMYMFISFNVSIPLLMDLYFSSRGYHPHIIL